MTDLTTYEVAARWLCGQRGENPDDKALWPGECNAVARWHLAAHELQKHDLMTRALEHGREDWQPIHSMPIDEVVEVYVEGGVFGHGTLKRFFAIRRRDSSKQREWLETEVQPIEYLDIEDTDDRWRWRPASDLPAREIKRKVDL